MTALAAQTPALASDRAADAPVALPMRAHTILGVCEAIGEDFGFNPLWLRIPLAASVVASPTFAIGAYLFLGLVVLASRLLAPSPKITVAHAAENAVVADHANVDVEEKLAA